MMNHFAWASRINGKKIMKLAGEAGEENWSGSVVPVLRRKWSEDQCARTAKRSRLHTLCWLKGTNSINPFTNPSVGSFVVPCAR